MFQSVLDEISYRWLRTKGVLSRNFLNTAESDFFSIQCDNPVISNPDFYKLLETIGIEFTSDDFIEGKERTKPLGDVDSHQKIVFSIITGETNPQAYVTITGRLLETQITIRKNTQTGQHQIDDAYIADIVDGVVDPNWLIPPDINDKAPKILKDFLPVFSAFAKEIYFSQSDACPTEIEVRLAKALKVFQEQVNQFEIDRYNAYEREIEDMSTPVSLEFTRK